MSVLVERAAGPAGRSSGSRVMVRPVRRREPAHPPTRIRVVAGSSPRRTTAPRATQVGVRRWPWLTALAVAAGLAVAGVGVLANHVAVGGPAGIPERTAVVLAGPGDTLSDVALRYMPGSELVAVVERIRELNGLSGGAVPAGTPLVVPVQS